MKRLYAVCFGAVLAGCATTSQVEELEKRIAKIEGDLYKVEVKSAPKQEAEPKFIPAKEVEQNVIDAKINSFLKEYLDVQFGDGIDRFPTKMARYGSHMDDRARVITPIKKFKYFDKAEGRFEDGKLYGVRFYADIDKKYSVDSTNEKVDQALADMAVTFGLASTAFGNGAMRGLLNRLNRQKPEPCSSYSLQKHNGEGAPSGYRRCGAVIEDMKLWQKYVDEKKRREQANGEKLPDAEVLHQKVTPAMNAVTEAKKGVDSIKGAVITYMLNKKKATPPRELDVVVETNGGDQPLLAGGEQALIDPWGNRFRMIVMGKRFAIVSNGPDGKPDTDDDIRSDKVRR